MSIELKEYAGYKPKQIKDNDKECNKSKKDRPVKTKMNKKK